jgi:hypothetical protein
MASIIQLILDAKNNASPALKQIASDLQHLDKSVSTLNKIATLDLGLTGLQAAFSTIQQVTQAIADTSQAGAQYDRLAKSFGNLAAEHNVGGQAIVSAIDEVTQGTLSYQTIMQQANNAMLLGVADTADEFSTLAKIAVDRGRAMGISMEYAFESIVKGVGRLSPLILDNLGIVLDADKTYGDFAKSIGRTADSLTDAEKRMALLERLKDEVQDFDSSEVMDAAGAWERLAAAMENATAAFGGWINRQGGDGDFLGGMADAINYAAGKYFSDDVAMIAQARQVEIEDFRKKIIEEQEKIDGYLAKRKAGKNTFLDEVLLSGSIKLLDQYKEKLRELTTAQMMFEVPSLGKNSNVSADMAILSALDTEYAKVSDTIVNWYAKALDISKDAARDSINSTIALKGSWEAAAPAIAEAGNQAIIAAQNLQRATALINSTIGSIESAALQAFVDSGFDSSVIESYRAINSQVTMLEDSLEGMNEIDAKFYMRQVAEEGAAGFKAITEYANESGKSIGGVATKTKQLTKEFQDLQSTVGSIVSSAYSDIGGADLSEFLPYQDQPGEDAKRIASVMVEGWDSEWVDYFKNKFPDLFSQYMGEAGGDIQAASALLLKDFQDGLRPELLDKGKIKELAKRMFLADQETSKMVDEIAQELAKELNITIEEAQAAVGGAAGIKKKIPTKEEIDKILGENNMTPKWKMDGAREKFVEAGKAAGLLDENGYLFVDVAVKMGTSGAIEGDYKLQISSFTFEDKKTLIENLQKATAINLLFTPWLPSTFATDFENNVASKLPKTMALQVVPAALEIERWNNFITGLEGAVSQVDFTINPSMSTDDFESLFAPIRTALAEGFVTQETLDLMVFNLSAGLGMTILQNEDSFTPNGALVAAFMINKFNELNVGMMMANSLATQLQQAQKTFETSAENSGKVWGDAFLKMVQANVPIELVRILSELVTPQVQQKANAEKNRGESE